MAGDLEAKVVATCIVMLPNIPTSSPSRFLVSSSSLACANPIITATTWLLAVTVTSVLLSSFLPLLPLLLPVSRPQAAHYSLVAAAVVVVVVVGADGC